MNEMVYIVLVNYNSWQDTVECIASLQQMTYKTFKIIVVDNASSDDSVSELQRRKDDIIFISNQENVGFAGGNNIGIDLAIQQRASYIWLLNNDTIVHPDSLQELVDSASQYTMALIGGKVYKYGTKREIWYDGGAINWWKGKAYHEHIHLQDDGGFTNHRRTQWISGCSMFAATPLFEQYSIEEHYFLYLEDVDFCCKLRAAGIPLVVIPGGLIWHKSSGSVSKVSYIQAYYSVRNNLYFMQKYGAWHHKVIYYPYFMIRTLIFYLKYFLRGVIRQDDGRKMLGKVYLKGLVDFFSRKYGKM